MISEIFVLYIPVLLGYTLPLACLIAITVTAVGTIVLFFYPDFAYDLLRQIKF